ncbi:MAG: PilC/PilY family type IV pilus protein [Thermodesulfobacteriota bacterium]
MKNSLGNRRAVVTLALFWAVLALLPVQARADVCSEGTGLPPFLSSGVEPNLLLAIDNSGSMLDPAYRDEVDDTQCFDDSYDNSKTYAGYFENDDWYRYYHSEGEFKNTGEATPAVCDTATYNGQKDGTKFVCLHFDSSFDPGYTFVATGNFMNWAASSKFDVEKKILTGGKYDEVNDQLQLESRGCVGRNYVKEQAVVDSASTPYKLTLGVRGPRENYEIWLPGKTYTVGDIVNYDNVLYKATATHTAARKASFSDVKANWAEYKETRWYGGQTYPANTAVYDVTSEQWYWTQGGGTSSSGSALAGDAGITDWVPYNGTNIDIFSVTADGFDMDACAMAMELLGTLKGDASDGDSSDPKSPLGQIKGYTEDCMGFDPGGGSTVESARKASFNHVMQECWYFNEFGHWQPGGGTVTSMKNACDDVYEFMDPSQITPYDNAYVCSGSFTAYADKSGNGYVGRCWEPVGSGTTLSVPRSCGSGRAIGDEWVVGSGASAVVYHCDDYANNSDNSAGADGTGELYECTTGNRLSECDETSIFGWSRLVNLVPGPDLAEEGWTNDPFYFFNPCRYDSCGDNDTLISECLDTADEDVNYSCTDSSGAVWTCNDTDGDGDTVPEECHIADVTKNGDRCVDQAIQDFCKIMSVPEVIDPSDSLSDTNELWNAPAFLVDGGVIGQLNRPLASMHGRIEQAEAPQGVLHSVANRLRLGAMAFNQVGSKTECEKESTSDAVDNYCPSDGSNKDGAQVITQIKSGMEVVATDATGSPIYHIDQLAADINDIRATAWTPLAEALYNGLSYYGQQTGRRLNAADWDSAWPDPVKAWCQPNHILLITEGASTADINARVADFAADYPDDAADVEGECKDTAGNSVLYGSTFLDDLTNFGHNGAVADIYATPQFQVDVDRDGDGVDDYKDKQNISTHIISTGALANEGTGECNPTTLLTSAATNGGSELMSGEDPAALEDNLRATLADILSRVSAGSAASVISSSRSGAGAVYQAIFWPKLQDNAAGDKNEVSWVGDVHALYLDDDGTLWEDTDSNRKLERGTDKRVQFYFAGLDSEKPRTRVCYGVLENPEDTNLNGELDTGEDQNDNGLLDFGCDGDSAEIDQIKYLWSAAAPEANGWLASLSATDIEKEGRASYISAEKARYIFTWNDFNNDGVVDGGTVADNGEVKNWHWNSTFPADVSSFNRGPVLNDMNVAGPAEFKQLVKWMRGVDFPLAEDANNDGLANCDLATEDTNGNGICDAALRPRKFVKEDGTDSYWLLGDVIHSTPTLVGRPMENYHFIYKDPSYALFAKAYANRRNVVYFGANDGMLHAVNAGFFKESESKFYLDQGFSDAGDNPALGAELWAYVPYNLQPHLKCLADPGYGHVEQGVSRHKYYVDQRPRIFDVQIFDDDADHPGGWGTILVGAMRFGGPPVKATDLAGGLATDKRKFTSAYFIFDITNPEVEPKLLAEMTSTTDSTDIDLSYTTSTPSLVIMRDKSGVTKWYLVLGNGPTTLEGENKDDSANGGFSDTRGRVAIVPLDDLVGELTWNIPADGSLATISMLNDSTRKPFRIPNSEPTDPTGMGRKLDTTGGATDFFISDFASVDYDVGQSAVMGVGAAYKSDAIYFGTTEGGFSAWGGRLMRMVTREMTVTDIKGDGIDPDDTYSQNMTDPWDWRLTTMIDAQGPVSSGPGIGWDGHNFWLYFGTGRFLSALDKEDTNTQRFFGVMEPVNRTTCDMVWSEISGVTSGDGTIDWSGPLAPAAADVTKRGLLKIAGVGTGSQGSHSVIMVEENSGALIPFNGITLPTDGNGDVVNSFSGLKNYIVGESCRETDDDTRGINGWYRELQDPGERNLGQAALLGGLVTFSSYRPNADACQAEGDSFLYGVHYQTGTAWIKNVFGTYLDDGKTIVSDRLGLGRGLALTPSMHVGSGDYDATAFVQTSTGEIIEIGQEELPLGNFRTNRGSWRQE